MDVRQIEAGFDSQNQALLNLTEPAGLQLQVAPSSPQPMQARSCKPPVLPHWRLSNTHAYPQ